MKPDGEGAKKDEDAPEVRGKFVPSTRCGPSAPENLLTRTSGAGEHELCEGVTTFVLRQPSIFGLSNRGVGVSCAGSSVTASDSDAVPTVPGETGACDGASPTSAWSAACTTRNTQRA